MMLQGKEGGCSDDTGFISKLCQCHARFVA